MDFIFRFKRRKNPHALLVMKTTAQAYEVYFSQLGRLLEALPAGTFIKQGNLNSTMRITIKRVWLKNPDYVTIELGGAGNADSFRGRTADLLILDEAAYVGSDTYFNVLSPTTDAVNGLELVTSTVNGDNWFYKNHDTNKEMFKEGYNDVNALDFDIYEARCRSVDWIRSKYEILRRAGKIGTWRQEYMNDPHANATPEKFPFAEMVREHLRRHKPFKSPFEGNTYQVVFCNIDMGKRGANPVWEWAMVGNKPRIIGFSDTLKNQYEIINHMINKYPGSKIVMVYPNDVMQPAINEGEPRISLIENYIRENKLNRVVECSILDKTKNRQELVNRGAELLAQVSIDVPACKDGLNKLTKVQMKEEKATGFISPKDFAKNDFQHVGDAWCYVAATLHEGRHRGWQPISREGDLQINNMALSYPGA